MQSPSSEEVIVVVDVDADSEASSLVTLAAFSGTLLLVTDSDGTSTVQSVGSFKLCDLRVEISAIVPETGTLVGAQGLFGKNFAYGASMAWDQGWDA